MTRPARPSRFISAVAFYGPKAAPLSEFLARVQSLIAAQAGSSFRPYSLEQMHATLIALNGVPGPGRPAIVNEYFLRHAGLLREMDLAQVTRILTERLGCPLRIRFGGYRAGQQVPFLSRGEHLHERALTVQGNAFVLIGWPTESLTGPGRPLDRLRRDMNAAGVLHRYHRRDGDIDDDCYLVVGHHDGAGDRELGRAAAAVRDELAARPAEFGISLSDVKIVAADSHTLAPPLHVGEVRDLPAAEPALRALMA